MPQLQTGEQRLKNDYFDARFNNMSSYIPPQGKVYTNTQDSLNTPPQQIVDIVNKAVEGTGINPNLILEQLRKESGFNPDSTSPSGAVGISQFMPATARSLGLRVDDKVDERRDTLKSINAHVEFMKYLLDKYGSVERALSAYNSGNPDAYLNPKWGHGETTNYVKSILDNYNKTTTSTPEVPQSRNEPTIQPLSSVTPTAVDSSTSTHPDINERRVEPLNQVSQPASEQQIYQEDPNINFNDSTQRVNDEFKQLSSGEWVKATTPDVPPIKPVVFHDPQFNQPKNIHEPKTTSLGTPLNVTNKPIDNHSLLTPESQIQLDYDSKKFNDQIESDIKQEYNPPINVAGVGLGVGAQQVNYKGISYNPQQVLHLQPKENILGSPSPISLGLHKVNRQPVSDAFNSPSPLNIIPTNTQQEPTPSLLTEPERIKQEAEFTRNNNAMNDAIRQQFHPTQQVTPPTPQQEPTPINTVPPTTNPVTPPVNNLVNKDDIQPLPTATSFAESSNPPSQDLAPIVPTNQQAIKSNPPVDTTQPKYQFNHDDVLEKLFAERNVGKPQINEADQKRLKARGWLDALGRVAMNIGDSFTLGAGGSPVLRGPSETGQYVDKYFKNQTDHQKAVEDWQRSDYMRRLQVGSMLVNRDQQEREYQRRLDAEKNRIAIEAAKMGYDDFWKKKNYDLAADRLKQEMGIKQQQLTDNNANKQLDIEARKQLESEKANPTIKVYTAHGEPFDLDKGQQDYFLGKALNDQDFIKQNEGFTTIKQNGTKNVKTKDALGVEKIEKEPIYVREIRTDVPKSTIISAYFKAHPEMIPNTEGSDINPEMLPNNIYQQQTPQQNTGVKSEQYNKGGLY